MTLRCFAVLAGMVVCIIAGSAAAQVPMMGNLPTFDSAPAAAPPGQMPVGPPMAPPPGAQQQGGPSGQDPCMGEFLPLREAAEKRAGLLKSAMDRKAQRTEFCKLFKDFAAAESKVVKFMSDKQSACRIPPEALTQVKANHDRTVKTRDNVCNPAAVGGPGAPAGPPPGPRLSDELGVRGIAGPGSTTPGRGTFDTLQGNPLAR
jgi:hypothetical protein